MTCGLETVGVRMPAHSVAQEIIHRCNFPLAAPSANSSGKPSPTTAMHVLNDLNCKIAAIVDGGDCTIGVESTVVDLLIIPPMILRPGGVTLEQLQQVIPTLEVCITQSSEFTDKPNTPGMKYKHYCPEATVILFRGQEHNQVNAIESFVAKNKKAEPIKRISLMASTSLLGKMKIKIDTKFDLGDNAQVIASNIFKGLRTLDTAKVDVILVQGVSKINEGLAIMNRLEKAASITIDC